MTQRWQYDAVSEPIAPTPPLWLPQIPLPLPRRTLSAAILAGRAVRRANPSAGQRGGVGSSFGAAFCQIARPLDTGESRFHPVPIPIVQLMMDKWYQPLAVPRDRQRWQYLYPSFMPDAQLFSVPVVVGPVQGTDPQIMMRASTDGGKTYGNVRMRSMGKIGEYSTRIVWNGIGTAHDMVFEVWGSDPVKVALTGANLDIEPLRSQRGVPAADGPPVIMRFSPDGGKTWGNQRTCSMGNIGEYGAVIGWNGVGTGNDAVFEVSGSDPVKVALTGAFLEIEVLNS